MGDRVAKTKVGSLSSFGIDSPFFLDYVFARIVDRARLIEKIAQALITIEQDQEEIRRNLQQLRQEYREIAKVQQQLRKDIELLRQEQAENRETLKEIEKGILDLQKAIKEIQERKNSPSSTFTEKEKIPELIFSTKPKNLHFDTSYSCSFKLLSFCCDFFKDIIFCLKSCYPIKF